MIQPKSILVINVSRIGDTLLATPAIRAIANAYPGIPVDVLGHPNRVEVLRHLPFVRHVGAIEKKTAPLRGWWALWSRCRYDLAFVYGFDLPLLSYALRTAKRVIAFRQVDDRINSRLYKVVEPPLFKGDHAVKLALLLPAAAGIVPAGLRLAYAVTQEEAVQAAARLKTALAPDAWPIIGLQIASFPTKSYRDWPIESFIELSQRILARWPKAHFLIFGGGEEKARTRALEVALGMSATHYAGQLTLRETGALMKALDMYIGVDTGPTHLMSAFDKPMVALYHAYSPSQLIGPLDHPHCQVIDHPAAGPDSSIEADMADITVDQVFERVSFALDRLK